MTEDQPDSGTPRRPDPPSGWHRILWLIGWPFRMVLLGGIKGYQRVISPLFGPSCRYHPSCSAYGVTAIERHGAAKGTLLTGWRLLRCNPWSGGGLDPVPDKGKWRPAILPDGRPRPGSS